MAMVFPGQGSQKLGMLHELALVYPSVKRVFEQASTALSVDLWQMTQQGQHLDQTGWTQPILLAASIAIWQLWTQQGGVKPLYLAGHSLGEYSALVASEVIEFESSIKLVHRRGQLMQQAVPQGKGAMAAILGLDDSTVQALCQATNQALLLSPNDSVQPANFNARGQVVIAGTVNAVQYTVKSVKEEGGKAILLPVSVPSHCQLMQGAATQFAAELDRLELKAPTIPVIHNFSAQPASDDIQLRQCLVEQLYSPVQWTQTMQYLHQAGVNCLVECGNGTVLTNLAKRLDFIDQALPTDTVARFEQALSMLISSDTSAI